MPELVEVEVLKKSLKPYTNTVFHSVYAASERFNASQGSGQVVTEFTRKGKFIICDLGGKGNLILHLGMSGSVFRSENLQDFKHVKAIFKLGSMYFHFVDPRGFGRFNYVTNTDLQTYSKTLSGLGMDVLDPRFDADSAASMLFRCLKNKPIKQVLLEQKVLAGVGNYIADEALYLANIHPLATNLSLQQCNVIVNKVKEVVLTSLASQGLSIKDYKLADGSKGGFEFLLQVYSRANQECFTCGTVLQRIKVAGRSSTFCPSCQRS